MRTMSKFVRGSILLALLTGSAGAQAQAVNPNGFPSGPHYNLNIIGKKADYSCTPVQVDEFGNLVYGNVIFVPEIGQGIQIVMKSGKKGGKASVLYPELRVTDACAGFDGDPAVLELPPSEKGYRVYARALAKPVEHSYWSISYSGSLFSAQDEYGNELVDLGLVTSGGVASPGETVNRTKGQSVAVPITDLFLWSGEICNIDFTLTSPVTKPLCWTDANLDGVISVGDTFTKPVDGICSSGVLTPVPVICTTYVDEWIFNIAELVASDWLVDNGGTKLVQIRFYPVQ